jgi:ParB family transcriptional regulator, chromosome partitioning protein
MAKKRPKINLSQPIQPQSGDLEKLFATEGDVEQASGLQLLAVRMDAIHPDPEQPRRTFPPESLQELSESIKQDGVIQPIEVTEFRPGQYRIVHGERRWRAAQIAGLETIPAVVQRRDYDEVTRFVRQLVENIQREDLNDVDRAAGLLRLRDLLQEELTAAPATESPNDPWARKVTWAKVGKRLGYSRQRIHQLIQLLKLPDEIKEDVRAGVLSERDTRIYQGLKMAHQRDLHQARMAGELKPTEVRQVARQLKDLPQQTLLDAIRLVRQAEPPTPTELEFDPSLDQSAASGQPPATSRQPLRNSAGYVEGSSIIPPRSGAPTSIDRLDYVRGHLARIQRQGLTAVEQKEILRLLHLIQQDVASLIAALENSQL